MTKLIFAILIAPFLIITFNWGLEKYIYLVFDVKDDAGASFAAEVLTLLACAGIAIVIAEKRWR